MNAGLIVVLCLVAVGVVIFAMGVRIVRQATGVVVERLGKYSKTLDVGVHFVLPLFDKTRPPVLLKERVADFPPQPVITKDNVTMQIDTVVYFQVTDVKLFTYGIENPIQAIENLTATTLRNIVGELELDETLTSRETVNTKMRAVLDEATDPWGIKINRVELKNILPPRDIQEAMEKQMRAERERREAILKAEGEKKANILVAEGEKQAVILKAEAEKERKILEAEAEKAKLIAESEGKAKAIELVNKANPIQAYITLEGYEALKALAAGESTKIVVPSDLANISGVLTGITEAVKTEIKKPNKKQVVKEEIIVNTKKTNKK